MRGLKIQVLCLMILLAACVAGAATHEGLATLKSGKAALQSAGVLAFGPDGILFVGDSQGAKVFALDTADRDAGSGKVNISGINEKVAAMLGTAADQVLINDMAVNPISKKVYFSVSRGRGPDATPVILRVGSAGKIEELALDNIKHDSVEIGNAVSADAKDRRGDSLRMQAITDLHYVDGQVFIAGLSNEEFSSNLRSVSFPFATADKGSSVEIFHGAHGRWETNSPVRTFVPYEVQAETNLLAAYTCTPLVRFPVSKLKPGTKVVGTTIAELGNRNRPLDMIVYKQGGVDQLLMTNSSRGVMKMAMTDVGKYDAITEPVKEEKSGLPYETIEQLKGIEQLDQLDDTSVVILARAESGSLDLKTIPLP
ncbi:MAG: hypothetical protein WD733_23195 [Bryobacterales bacterium]